MSPTQKANAEHVESINDAKQKEKDEKQERDKKKGSTRREKKKGSTRSRGQERRGSGGGSGIPG